MNYEILFDKPAQKFILKQQQEQRKRLLFAISKLPDIGDIKAMKGCPNLFRLRVGDYRVIYTVEPKQSLIRILNIGNRGDIYKQ